MRSESFWRLAVFVVLITLVLYGQGMRIADIERSTESNTRMIMELCERIEGMCFIDNTFILTEPEESGAVMIHRAPAQSSER